MIRSKAVKPWAYDRQPWRAVESSLERRLPQLHPGPHCRAAGWPQRPLLMGRKHPASSTQQGHPGEAGLPGIQELQA